MFETPSSSVDNLVHSFVQNFGLKIIAVDSVRAQKVKYITCIDRAQKMKRNLSLISDKARDIVTQNNLDFSDLQNVQCCIKKQTNFFDKFYTRSVPLLAPYLKHIDKNITQRVGTMKQQDRNEEVLISRRASNETSSALHGRDFLDERDNARRCNDKDGLPKSLSCYALSAKEPAHKRCQEKRCRGETRTRSRVSRIPLPRSKQQYDCGEIPVDRECTKYSAREIAKEKLSDRDFWWIHKKKGGVSSCNLTAGMARYTQKETELNERYLQLNIKNLDFIKQKVKISLYIVKQDKDMANFKISSSRRHQILLLCKQAIMSSIEPSDNAFVIYEENLSDLIQNHLGKGCEYHFSYSRVSQECYYALLVLSHWAALLVRHPNTTLMRTIGFALGCSPSKILVLSYPEDDS